ncbi:MAG TPA: aldehyde dehydrogenase family protein [Polyangiales bacterium]|nr:aldehyde dehydrogenase family protein [Polyangiales bacterium]
MTSPRFPEPPASIPPTSINDVDAAVERVASKKEAWIATSIPERISLLELCLAGVESAASAWVRDMCRVKGFSPEENLAGEEWLAGPATTARNVRLLIQALQANGAPKLPDVSQRPNGQWVARVTPGELKERLMFAGVTVDVWIEPGKPPSQGRIYREPKGPGKVSLVLGAGNVSSIPPMDVLYKLFVEDEVVVLKMNPVNAVAGPHIARAFAALVDAGFLAVVYGGAEVGAHLANHPKVDTLHVTGSDRTYDAIVWGTDPAEQARRKSEGKPINTRPFSAELGCVTPCMIVPGDWSEDDLEFQARHVVSMVAQNASFNCNAAKVLVTAKGWPQRERFLEKVHAALARAPARKAYYPGAETRYCGFLDKYPAAKPLGAAGEGIVPWTVIPNVPAKHGEYALTNEAFCGVLAEVELEATTAAEFLERAVQFANDDCWGTLSCMLMIDEATARRESKLLDSVVERLRYGGVCINSWAGLLYALASPTWGAFPGHPNTDIQSGTGVVHNTFLLDYPQKSVVRAPFRIRPAPAWFFDHKNLLGLGKSLLHLEASGGVGNFVATALAGMKG